MDDDLLIGDTGADHILASLSNTHHPLQFIEEFQKKNGIDAAYDKYFVM